VITAMHTNTDSKAWVTGNESFVLEVSSALAASLAARARRMFSHARLSIALQGVLAVAVGLAVLTWPSPALAAMVVVFAVYAVADGLLSFLGALAEQDGADVVRGTVSLGAAAVTLAWREVSAVALLYVMAVWVIAMALFRIRHTIESRTGLLVKGLQLFLDLAAVAAGVAALIAPGEGANSVLVNVAIFQIINGLGIVGLGLRATATEPDAARRIRGNQGGHPRRPAAAGHDAGWKTAAP
jgi:uncharacterized membrane protein HdeD (DUF308 family)